MSTGVLKGARRETASKECGSSLGSRNVTHRVPRGLAVLDRDLTSNFEFKRRALHMSSVSGTVLHRACVRQNTYGKDLPNGGHVVELDPSDCFEDALAQV